MPLDLIKEFESIADSYIQAQEAINNSAREEVELRKKSASIMLKAQRDAARIMAQEHNEAAEAGLAQGSGKLKKIVMITGSVTAVLLVISLLLLFSVFSPC